MEEASMRHAWKILTALALIGLGLFALPAMAGAPKVVFIDDFTATW
jgi:hypothetical protein